MRKDSNDFLFLLCFYIIIFFGVFSLVFSCTPEPDPTDGYEYATDTYLPDENVDKLRAFITETVSASNFHMTGGYYEDPEDVLDEAERIGRKLYEKKVVGLIMRNSKNSHLWEFVPYDELTPKQKEIFEMVKPQ